MKDRIQINGEWYVKEDTITQEEIINTEELSHTIQCAWENENWCFRASLFLKGDETDINNRCANGFDIEITHKRPKDIKDWVVTNVDNLSWIKRILENKPKSIEYAYEIFDNDGLKYFKAFLNCLFKKGWLD
jgi:hypothetical protein